MKSSVGYNVDFKPETDCGEDKCPHHGTVSVRGKVFEGDVVSDLMQNSVKVEWERLIRDKKYSRYYKGRSKVTAHNPECIDVKKGDRVLIGETRPLSKTKHFVVLKVLKNESDKKE